jgi:GWxTD domain-containing protein
MKKSLLLFILFCSITQYIEAQKLETNVAVRSCVFLHPQEGNYAETYLTIAANALSFEKIKTAQYQAGVEVQIMILEGSTVISFDKYRLNTPVIADTSEINFSIVDQKRLPMPAGAASIEVHVTDVHQAENTFSSTVALLPISPEGIQVSDIQFAESYKQATAENNFTKNGIEMQPYPLNFFASGNNKIIFYGEIYHTDSGTFEDQFLATFSIRPSANDAQETKLYQYAKYDKAPVVSFLKEFDITDLPSGNYNLIVEIRNRKNELLAQKKTFIQRANKGSVNYYENIAMINTGGTFVDDYTEEQLNYFLDVIKPRANSNEAKLIESLSLRVEPEMKKKFLYNFWLERDIADPKASFHAYLADVKKANESFGTPSKAGYKTDRGRVYLQYGAPYDRVFSTNEPGAYPYEIWFYDKLPDKQTQIGFAFYEPSLVTNDYILLHSNARGELHDQRWKIKIYENVASPEQLFDYDNTEVADLTGGHRAVDIYDF